MASQVLCRYYMNGCCAYGSSCRFSHDRRDAPSQVCKFYLAGHCAYGDQCRYDHIRPDHESRAPAGSGAGGPAAASSSSAASSSYPRSASASRGGGADGSRDWAAGAGSTAGLGPSAAAAAPAAADGAGACAVPSSSEIYKLPSGADELGMFESAVDTGQDGGGGSGIAAAHGGGYHGSGGGLEGYEGYGDGGVEGNEGYGGGGGVEGSGDAVVDPADIPLCGEYAATGDCGLGEDCTLVHGDLCEVCGAYALHPYSQEAAADHLAACMGARGLREQVARDRQLECGICLERVLEKPDPSQRRFGLMACEHPFCLGCIRSWRATDDVDVDSALRTCPVCRTTTHFITPSSTWPRSPEEKERIIAAYKAKMAAIDCMHFDFGEGTCPFGTSCFYRHAYRDGRLAPPPELRRAANDEGEVRVLRPVSLSSFFDTPAAQQLLSAAPRRRLANARR